MMWFKSRALFLGAAMFISVVMGAAQATRLEDVQVLAVGATAQDLQQVRNEVSLELVNLAARSNAVQAEIDACYLHNGRKIQARWKNVLADADRKAAPLRATKEAIGADIADCNAALVFLDDCLKSLRPAEEADADDERSVASHASERSIHSEQGPVAPVNLPLADNTADDTDDEGEGLGSLLPPATGQQRRGIAAPAVGDNQAQVAQEEDEEVLEGGRKLIFVEPTIAERLADTNNLVTRTVGELHQMFTSAFVGNGTLDMARVAACVAQVQAELDKLAKLTALVGESHQVGAIVEKTKTLEDILNRLSKASGQQVERGRIACAEFMEYIGWKEFLVAYGAQQVALAKQVACNPRKNWRTLAMGGLVVVGGYLYPLWVAGATVGAAIAGAGWAFCAHRRGGLKAASMRAVPGAVEGARWGACAGAVVSTAAGAAEAASASGLLATVGGKLAAARDWAYSLIPGSQV